MEIKLTKENYRKFTKSSLFPDGSFSMPKKQADVERLYKNVTLLENAYNMYSSLQQFRENRWECINYFFGDQLSRHVPDPDMKGKTITIHDYCVKQGMTPLVLNVITSRIRQMVGVYEKQKLEDLVVSRGRDEQKKGEMMTIAMQKVYQSGDFYRANADGYREFLLGALVPFRTGFDWCSERKAPDAYVELSDVDTMFFDDNTGGLYFEKISTIGQLHEYSQLEILSKFAKTPAMRLAILEAFKEPPVKAGTEQLFTKDRSKKKRSFWTAIDPNKYRIIEVWHKEEHEAYECYDPLEDNEPYYTIDVSELPYILQKNQERRDTIASFGGDPNDAPEIDARYRVDTEWVVRYMTPSGHVLMEAVSPYKHGGHPWAIGGYPMVNGRIHSLVQDLIPAQDMINRLLMRTEFVQMNKAKGFGIVDQDVLAESGITVEEFAQQYTSAKGIIALKTTKVDGIKNVFMRFNDDTAGSSHDYQMFQTYLELINQQSGSTDAARGMTGSSGEPASRYMMETENSNNNTADGEMWYNGLLLRRDAKVMSLIQQYYEGVRYINIAGKDYSEEAKYYDSEKMRDVLMDLSIIQSPSSGAVRFQMEEALKNLFEAGAIDANTYLESTSIHGADKILERKKSRDEELAQQQAEMQQQAQQQAQAQQQMAAAASAAAPQ